MRFLRALATSDPMSELSAASPVIPLAMDPSTEVLVMKGVIAVVIFTGKITDDLSFDDYMAERTISEVLCSLKSSSKCKRTPVAKNRASTAIVNKEAFSSTERRGQCLLSAKHEYIFFLSTLQFCATLG